MCIRDRAWMMQDEDLKRTPPKTTGREMYGDAYVEQLLKKEMCIRDRF